MKNCDVIVVGAGPGGIAAACAAKNAGTKSVLVLERDIKTGGILNQCIHDGFGLIHYHRTLTGPEYADLDRSAAQSCGVEILTGAMVTDMTADHVISVVTRQGMQQFRASAVVMATGCRERTRGAISIPGSRPAGIYTAGTAQRLINVDNIMVGRKVVVLGSGDVGLIVSRRLTLSGSHVECVVEMMPQPCGLERNISQCLNDFDIPLYVSHTVSKIYGKERLTGVDIVETDEMQRPISGTKRHIDCDTLILSVGLIPENEVAKRAGIMLDEQSNGVVTDEFLQSSVPGIFACGNARRVMDLADFVSEQGSAAGRNAALFVQGKPLTNMPVEKHNRMKKGFPEEDCITCILCPNGCSMHCGEDGAVIGNGCPRGETYARQERMVPSRTLTATMQRADGLLIPVKSSDPLPKDEILHAAQVLDGVTLPVKTYALNEIVVPDFLGLGIEILTTAETC